MRDIMSEFVKEFNDYRVKMNEVILGKDNPAGRPNIGRSCREWQVGNESGISGIVT